MSSARSRRRRGRSTGWAPKRAALMSGSLPSPACACPARPASYAGSAERADQWGPLGMRMMRLTCSSAYVCSNLAWARTGVACTEVAWRDGGPATASGWGRRGRRRRGQGRRRRKRGMLCPGFLDSLASGRIHSSLLLSLSLARVYDSSIVRLSTSVLRKRRDSIYSVTISPCPCLSVRSDGAPTRAAEHGRLRGDRGAGCGLHCRPYVCSAAAHHMGKFQLHVLSQLGHGPLVRERLEEQAKGALTRSLSGLLLSYILTNQSLRRRGCIVTTGGGRSGRAEACGHAELWTSDFLADRGGGMPGALTGGGHLPGNFSNQEAPTRCGLKSRNL